MTKYKISFLQKHTLIISVVIGCLFYFNSGNFIEMYQNKLKHDFLSKTLEREIESNFIIKNNKIDNYSDCVLMSVGLINKGSNLFDHTILAPSIFGCNELKSFLLYNIIPKDFEILKNNLGFKNYGRYWNGSQIITKPILLIGGLKTVQLLTLLLGIFIYLIFVLITVRKLGFNSLFLLIPFLVNFNINQFFLVTHLIPIAIPLLMTSRLLKNNFEIGKLCKINMFIFGFYWWFFSYLVNPILLIAIPISAYIVYSELYSVPVRTRLKNIFNIVVFPCLGLLSSICLKFILIVIVKSDEIQNYRDSNYWRFPVDFKQSFQNINLYNNMTIYWVSALVVVFICSTKLYDINFYYYVFLFILGLLYPLFLKSHTMHNFSGASSYPIIVSTLLMLRFLSAIFVGSNSLYFNIKMFFRKITKT
jgi:hypothetical protein